MDLNNLTGPQRSELEMCVRQCIDLILKKGGHAALLRSFGWSDAEIEMYLVTAGVA